MEQAKSRRAFLQGGAAVAATAFTIVDPQSVSGTPESPKTHTDFEKVLSDPGVDAVMIVSPPFEHPRMFQAALQSKKHIYLEKPIGVSVDDCKRVIRWN